MTHPGLAGATHHCEDKPYTTGSCSSQARICPEQQHQVQEGATQAVAAAEQGFSTLLVKEYLKQAKEEEVYLIRHG